MRQINVNIKKIAALIVVVCLLLSVIGFVSISIIQKIEFEKSCQLLENDLNKNEEKNIEDPNEAFDYIIYTDTVQLNRNVLAREVVFLYIIARETDNFIDIHRPPPKC